MADETTPRLNLVKPEVGGSADTWGDKWNENADKIDAAIIKPNEENVWSAPQRFEGGLYAGTTSPTDTTEGRVLKVGDFGVGEPIILTSSDDLDDIMSPGIYMHTQVSAPANTPIPDAGTVTVFKGTSSYVVQVWCSRSWIIRKFQRVLHPNDGWSSWVEFYHTGNINRLISDANLVQTSRTISTGTGLTGGGDLSANRTISIDPNYDASLVKTSRTISTGTGLTGGGNLSANRTISIDPNYDASLVKTSRTISTGTGLTGGGNLSANRTISLATSHIPIGVGQTWQDVTGQRSADTIYTNTTGRPIYVALSSSNDGGVSPQVSPDGTNWVIVGTTGQSALSTCSFVVPAGWRYRATRVGYVWAELR